jgi:hypothetical protein
MLGEAAGFAVLAAISPTALVVMAIFLSSASPRESATAYAAGALVMTVLMAVVVLFVIRFAGLDQPRQHDPLYGLRLGLGVLALGSAAFVALRRPKRREPPAAAEARSGLGSRLMSRIVANPSPTTAFVAGLILFAPGATFIAAVQVVASARSGTRITVLALVIIVLLTAVTAWLPLVTYLAAPRATERRLAELNAWLRARGKLIAVIALAVAGVALVANGALGLAEVI